MKLQRWNIITFTAFLLLLPILIVAFTTGYDEQGIRGLIRSTARSSLILFLMAFSASSLYLLFKTGFTKWMMQNRRYIGLSFALSHFVHLGAILALAYYYPHPFLDQIGLKTYIGGGAAYAFILAMSITSFMPVRKRMSPKHWKLLHVIGSYYFWFVFAQSYLPKSLDNYYYMPFAILLVITLLLRNWRRVKS